MKIVKFKGYSVVDKYPEDGWLKGYFYVSCEDCLDANYYPGLAYQDLSYIRHKDYALQLLDIKDGDIILDIGCANGVMMVYCGLCAGRGEVYGQDISETGVTTANNYLKRFNIKGKAVVGDVKKLKFPDKYFDKVVSSDFYEHLSFEDNVIVLKEVLRVLKPYGLLVIKTPNIVYLKLSLWFKRFKALLKFRNPFKIIIPHTVSIEGEKAEHIGLSSRAKIMKALDSAGFNNYSFCYSRNSKIDRISPYINAIVSCEIPFLRDIFSEDVIVIARKSVILYGF